MSSDVEELTRSLADRYEVVREIGRGGTSVVYLATDLKHGRRVALKLLTARDRSMSHERFLQEIRTTAQLHHPHLLPLYDSGEAGDGLFFSMPYVEAGTLRQRLRRDRKLPVAFALRVTEQVGRALAYAHSQGIVHRDVKPENIMLSATGDALVTDFGIAYPQDEARRRVSTGEGIVVGTPAYMSPEQMLGAHDLDARSDLYSLACVLFEMLAGYPPFLAKEPSEMLNRRLHEEPLPIRLLAADVPAGVERALLRALARNPADRFESIGNFLEELARPSALRVLVLGGLSLLADGRPVPDDRVSDQELALLALLVHAGPRGVPRDRAVTLIWPQADPNEGRRLLGDCVRALRRELGLGDAVVAGRTVVLHEDVVTSDLADFRAAVGAGEAERAVAVYEGAFLQGFYLTESPKFDEWVRQSRQELELRFRAALEHAAREAMARDDHPHAILWWRRLAAEDPLNGRVARGLMLAFAAAGDRPSAIRHAELYEALIEQEIGLPADLDVIALADEMRRGADVSHLAETLEHEVPATPLAPATPAEPRPGRRRLLRAAIALVIVIALMVLVARLDGRPSIPMGGQRAVSTSTRHQGAVVP